MHMIAPPRRVHAFGHRAVGLWMLAVFGFVLAPLAAQAQKTDSETTIEKSAQTTTFGQSLTLAATVSGRGRATPTGSVKFFDSYHDDDLNELGVGALTAAGIGIAQIGTGDQHSCALANDGRVFCWGGGGSGQLGNGTVVDSLVPVPVSTIETATSISVGQNHACAVLQDKTVHCWGIGGSGRLGNGSTANALTPVLVANLSNVRSVEAGDEHTCAVLEDKTVVCWGAGGSGRLGTQLTIDSAEPVPVFGVANALAVSAGAEHTCAIIDTGAGDGTVECWGNGGSGRLGNNSALNSFVPVSTKVLNGTDLANVINISAGHEHTCAVVRDGRAFCWGKGDSGRLGNNAETDSLVAVAVSGFDPAAGPKATAVSVGSAHGCALIDSGKVQCWGQGGSGRLGSNSVLNQKIPVDVSGIGNTLSAPKAHAIAAGSMHSCALLEDGKVQCWGSNGKGRLGINTTDDKSVPNTVVSLNLRTLAHATLANGTLPVGDYLFFANYEGDTALNASESHAVSHSVLKASQTINFNLPSPQAFPFLGKLLVSATATSGLPVSFSSTTTNVCTVTNNFVTVSSLGVCGLTASQPGNDNFEAAQPISRTVTITKGSQAITVTQPSPIPFSPSATVRLNAMASSGLPVSFASTTPTVCTVSGNVVSVRSAGSCSITASQAGNTNFNAAPVKPFIITILKATQTITYTKPAQPNFYPGMTVQLNVVASSRLPVSLIQVTPKICTIMGTSVTFRGPGSCTLQARQNGNGNFNAAQAVTISLKVINGLNEDQKTFAVPGVQSLPSIASLGTGAVITYNNTTSDNIQTRREIQFQRLSANGARLGSAVTVAGPFNIGVSHVATLTNGGFVVVWHETSPSKVFAQRFKLDGTVNGPKIDVTPGKGSIHSNPRVAALPNGQFVVTWQMERTSTRSDIVMLRLTADGKPMGTRTQVSTVNTVNEVPSVAALSDGTVAIVWASVLGRTGKFDMLRARLYRANGTALTAEMTVELPNQVLAPQPAIVARTGTGANGGFAMAYQVGGDIVVRTISAAGALSPPQIANSGTAGIQSAPALAAMRSGGFAVAFRTPDKNKTGHTDIAMRLFSANGVPAAQDMLLNTEVDDIQITPALAPLGVGSALGATGIGVWATPSANKSGNDLAVRRFQGL